MPLHILPLTAYRLPPTALTVLRPPDFFPPAAHAALLASATQVVLLDTLAFSRQSTHNRTRVLTSQGPLWLSVPRRHAPVGTPLTRVAVVYDGWPGRHLRALRSAYGMAPFVDWVLADVEALLGAPYASVGDLASATTEWAVRRLGGPASVVRASGLPGAPDTLAAVWEAAGRPDVLTLAETLDRDRAALGPLGARVEALAFSEAPRRQVWPAPGGFARGLSVLDVLVTYGPDARHALLGSSPPLA